LTRTNYNFLFEVLCITLDQFVKLNRLAAVTTVPSHLLVQGYLNVEPVNGLCFKISETASAGVLVTVVVWTDDAEGLVSFLNFLF
jgi:hypothetical protein